jgi:CDP-diacylglycerol--inositol 3-phosphatidyltransferase
MHATEYLEVCNVLHVKLLLARGFKVYMLTYDNFYFAGYLRIIMNFIAFAVCYSNRTLFAILYFFRQVP